MAKKFNIPKHIVGRNITTKSAFGSHSDMIVSYEDPIIQTIKIDDNQIICKDDSGYYVTYKNRIDSGLSDPNRYANNNSRKLFKELDTANIKE